jgi:transposase
MSLINIKNSLEKKSKEEIIEDFLNLYKQNNKLKDEKEKLENELKKYKNAHTPSSKNKFNRPRCLGLKVGRKKGKISGHKGKTRPKDEADKTIDVYIDKNPITGNKNIVLTGNVEKISITDFKIIKIVTQYNCYEYRDIDTGDIFVAKHADMPEKGIFGKNVLTLANFLRFKCRVPFEKIASTFTSAFKIPMTAPTAMDICNRVANKVSPYYNELELEIKNQKAVNIDETGAKKNGQPGWLWGFFSLTIALLIFNKRRGGDIVERLLGKDFKGVIGCDGWSTYSVFSKKANILLQRCWAHAIRELKDLCINDKKKNRSLERAYAWFCEIFEKVKETRTIKCKEMREQIYMELIEELNNWIQIYSSYKSLKTIIKKIKNGNNFWFTCVLYPEIEPTNNRAERGLRPWVVLEKIIGCLRSDQGQMTTQIMMSLFSTWDLRNINCYEQLRDML